MAYNGSPLDHGPDMYKCASASLQYSGKLAGKGLT